MNNYFNLLIEVKEAYKFASFLNIIYRLLKKSNLKFKLFILFMTLLLIVMPFVVINFVKLQLSYFVLLTLGILFLGIVFYFLEKKLKVFYNDIYKKYPHELNIYKFNRIYLRYSIFYSKLLNKHKIAIDDIETIQMLLEKENSFFNISIFKQYPIISVLLVIVTALINGMASQTYLWKNEFLFVMLYLIILLLSLSFFFAESLKSKDYYNKELDLFLTWLKNDLKVKTLNKPER